MTVKSRLICDMYKQRQSTLVLAGLILLYVTIGCSDEGKQTASPKVRDSISPNHHVSSKSSAFYSARLLEFTVPSFEDVVSLAISDDGKVVAASTADLLLHIWTAETGERIHVANPMDMVSEIAFTHAGSRLLLAGSVDEIEVWSLTPFEKIGEIELNQEGDEVYHYGVQDMTISPDDTKLAFTATGEVVMVYSLDNYRRLYVKDENDIREGRIQMGFDEDGNHLTIINGHDDHLSFKSVDLSTGGIIRDQRLDSAHLIPLAISSSGKILVSNVSSGNGVSPMLLEVNGNEPTRQLPHGITYDVIAGALSANADRAFLCVQEGDFHRLVVWNISENEIEWSSEAVVDINSGITTSRDGSSFVTASANQGIALLWERTR